MLTVFVHSMQKDPVVSKASELLRLGLMPSPAELRAGKVSLSQQQVHAHRSQESPGHPNHRHPDGQLKGKGGELRWGTCTCERLMSRMLYRGWNQLVLLGHVISQDSALLFSEASFSRIVSLEMLEYSRQLGITMRKPRSK